MSWYPLLTITHIIGTVLGVGGATFGEVLYLRAIQDGKIDETERGMLRVTLGAMRIGLILLVLSGFGYLLMFRLTGETTRLYHPVFWAKMTIVLILVFNSALLHVRRMPAWIGAPLSFTSWYAALVLGSWRGLDASYAAVMLVYVAAVVIVGFALHFIDQRARPHDAIPRTKRSRSSP